MRATGASRCRLPKQIQCRYKGHVTAYLLYARVRDGFKVSLRCVRSGLEDGVNCSMTQEIYYPPQGRRVKTSFNLNTGRPIGTLSQHLVHFTGCVVISSGPLLSLFIGFSFHHHSPLISSKAERGLYAHFLLSTTLSLACSPCHLLLLPALYSLSLLIKCNCIYLL